MSYSIQTGAKGSPESMWLVLSPEELAEMTKKARLSFNPVRDANPPAVARIIRGLRARKQLEGAASIAVILGVMNGIVAADLLQDELKVYLIHYRPTNGHVLTKTLLGPGAEERLAGAMASLETNSWGDGYLKKPAVARAVRSMSEIMGPSDYFRVDVSRV